MNMDYAESHGTAHDAARGQGNWTFACVTFGCKVNQYETQAIREAWLRAGGSEVEDPAGADLVLVNSCAITSRAERDARNALTRMHRDSPSSLLVLTGCAARLVADFVPRRHAPVPRPDSVFVQERKEDLCREDVIAHLVQLACQKRADTRSAIATPDVEDAHWKDLRDRPYPAMQIERYKRVRPVLKVQDGCTHRCTYCIVPLTRGPHVSRRPEEVVAEARRLLQDHAEIMLSGVNLGQYGRDNRAFGDFWDLVQRLNDELAPEFAGRRRIRISSLEPSQLDERGCTILAGTSLIVPHLHISLQHASSSVLKRMGRGHYSAETLTRALERLSKAWPVMGLGADIIVGFPGETEEEFEASRAFIDRINFYETHIFKYSRREGTRAAVMDGQVPDSVKTKRSALLLELGKKKQWEYEEKLLGTTREVLMEEAVVIGGETWQVGHTKEYVKIGRKTKEDLSNQLVNVEIESRSQIIH